MFFSGIIERVRTGVFMFLKKIEMKGFKSFADHVVINFEESVTGIVGPNGCGKSNISDAIRWVLGEQSVKSMRGSSMTDVIFNGTESRRKVNLAEVTLVFNNALKVLNSEFAEVEVTRRLFRDTRESEYLINKVPCRLRDIHDLVMDTGLGRDSLSIISQGSISFFAESKPIERRVIFEEAAGVSKYKRRKVESIRKLERTQENIERMQDIVDEISKQVAPLKRAAKKADLYIEKRDALEKIEVSVLVSEIETLSASIDATANREFDLESNQASLEAKIGVFDHELVSKRAETFEMDQTLVKSQETMMELVREIGVLETRKIEIDEKRKYALEVGNKEEKAAEIRLNLADAKVEYEERLERQRELKAEVDLLNMDLETSNTKLASLNQNKDFSESQRVRLENRIEVLNHRLKRPFETSGGVQTILDNRSSLYGIHDVVANILIPYEAYEEAINTTLAGAMRHIVTTDDQGAIQAIDFLKRNRSGRATFIPLSVVKERFIHHDALTVCEHAQGFLGVASEFVEHEAQYDVLCKNLLGNVIVVDTLENANILAKRLGYRFRVVTLDGDVIHQGGLMSGGRDRDSNTSNRSITTEIDSINTQLEKIKITVEALELELHQLKGLIRKNNDHLMEKRIALAQLEPLLDVKRAKYERLQSEFDALDIAKDDTVDIQDTVILQLNQALMKRDELATNMGLARERRLSLSNAMQRMEGQIREHRRELSDISTELNGLKMKSMKDATRRESILERLSNEYQMTYEYALEHVYDPSKKGMRDEVLKLRSDITKLGNVNLDAPKEYEEVNERYTFLSSQLDDLISSRTKLLSVIDELDSIMEVQFIEMFNKINEELKSVFAKLFNGGRAKLILEDPNDILNTGVDIDVQPPGKSVQNIRLFSGGEKSLIAISVLFSIINARHVPLCVFDEVEAALDQVNVERLANYIKELSKDTQFILITHRPGTMQRADTLYGVTMPNHGVSSLLKVKLDEAIEMRDDEVVTNA